ncbi:hypothetical protein Ddye_021268 [Dipteronia dyeriana]|uniref:Reverse transcriptase domain-containing protein n=1 Tax=Dipteronia dyeriana TaxID=168575 RepID=A0AAD9U237_9ROSI|nr:hypothetical protein Ddye_021268 [Dipteronia dyeriana]
MGMGMGSCVLSPMLSILVNGSPTSQFDIKRGLRQGDPLSPFLLNIASEGLSSPFRKAGRLDSRLIRVVSRCLSGMLVPEFLPWLSKMAEQCSTFEGGKVLGGYGKLL